MSHDVEIGGESPRTAPYLFDAGGLIARPGDSGRGPGQLMRHRLFAEWGHLAVVPLFQEPLGKPRHIRDFRVEDEGINDMGENECQQSRRVLTVNHPGFVRHR